MREIPNEVERLVGATEERSRRNWSYSSLEKGSWPLGGEGGVVVVIVGTDTCLTVLVSSG